MAFHTHPLLRFRETAEINAGILIPQNSVGYTLLVNQETAGLRPKEVPPPMVLVLRGTYHTPTAP